MLTYYHLKNFLLVAAMVALISSISACAMKGYQIDLKTHLPGNALPSMKDTLLEMGFFPEILEEKWQGKPATIERYIKDVTLSNKGLFGGDRKTFLEVHVILFDTPRDVDGNRPATVEIYNKYEGSKPEIKPLLIKAADTLEQKIKRILPETEIHRSEYLTGVPFI